MALGKFWVGWLNGPSGGGGTGRVGKASEARIERFESLDIFDGGDAFFLFFEARRFVVNDQLYLLAHGIGSFLFRISFDSDS